MSNLIIVGNAGVQLVPSAKGFGKKTDALLAGLNADVRLDPDAGKARAEIAELTRDRKTTIRAKADTAGAEASLSLVARTRTAIIRADGFGTLLTLALALGPALVPIIAGLGGIAVALAAPILLAGGGLLAFAGFAFFAAKDSDRVNAAVKRLKTTFAQFADSKAGLAVKDVLVKALDLLAIILPKIGPLLIVVSKALDGLLNRAKKAVGGGGFDKFIRMMSEDFAPALKGLLSFLGNVGRGFGSMARAAAQTGFMEKSLKGLTKATEGWSNIGKSPKFRAFLDYMIEVGPLVSSAIADVVGALVHIGKALAPIGGVALKALQELANAIKSIPVPVLTALAGAFISVAIGMKAMKVGSTAVSGVTSIIDGAKSGASALGRFKDGFGNAAAAQSAFSGKMGTLGGKVRSAMTAAGTAVKTGVTTIVAGMRTIGTAFLNAGKAALTFALNVLKATASAIASVIRATVSMLIQAAIQIGSWILIGITALISAAQIALAWIIAFWPIALIIAAVVLLVVVIVKNWDTIKAKTIAIWSAISSFLANAWNTIKAKATGAWNAIKTKVSGAVDGLKTAVTSKFSAVLTFIKSIPTKIVDFFSTLGSKMKTIGTNIADGLLKGVQGAWHKVSSWVRDAVNAIPLAVRKALGIASPSKVFMEIGGFMGEGLAVGLDNSGPDVNAATTTLVQASLAAQYRTPASAATAGDRPIFMADGTLFGWIRRIANGEAELVLNQQLAFDGVTGRMG